MAKTTEPSPKPKIGTITIGDKDLKILWARAAGKCSICRKELTWDTADKSSVTLGEMCHIIGEKERAARGKSDMALSDRNSYSNLILLCAHHHKIIDRDEKMYTIENLHKIKDDHEIWVNESLSGQEISANELVYSSLIDIISVSLQLDQWNWFIDNAVRQLVHQDFIFAADTLNERLMATDFPGEKTELEQAIKGVMEAYIEYIDQYLSTSVAIDSHGFYRFERVHRKDYRSPDFWRESEENNFWARENFLLLCKFVWLCCMNPFAQV